MRPGRGRLRWLVTIAAAGSVGLLVFSTLTWTYVRSAGRAGSTVAVWDMSGGVIGVALVRARQETTFDASLSWAPQRPYLIPLRPYFEPNFKTIALPMTWFALPLSCGAAWMWFAPIGRRKRSCGRTCVDCGYDLSGSPGAVCPECGGEAGV